MANADEVGGRVVPEAALCEYQYSDDYYSEGHACELPKGHGGPHSLILLWETRSEDVCLTEGHVWPKRWTAITEDRRDDISDVLWGITWEKKPTHERQCKRCGQWGRKGGKSHLNRTVLTPFSNLLPRVSMGEEFKAPTVTWAEDRLNPSD